jgi:hypothetical protein
MDLAIHGPEALVGPTGTKSGVSSNSSNIQNQQLKPNHYTSGEESTYIFSAWVHKQRPCMPMATRTTEEKIRTSYRLKLSLDVKIKKKKNILCTLFRPGVQCPIIGKRILKILR